MMIEEACFRMNVEVEEVTILEKRARIQIVYEQVRLGLFGLFGENFACSVKG